MTLVPTITQITPATWSANDIIAAISTHFNGVSTRFTRQYSGTDAMVIRSDLDTVPQYSLRATSSSVITMEIEPSGSLSDAGNTSTRPAGASADNSGTRPFTIGSLSGSSKLWVVELLDAFFLFFTSSTGTTWQPGLHMGRVYVPDFPDIDEPLGRDGLGMLYGVMNAGNSTGSYLILYQNNTYPDTDYGLVHDGTNRWNPPSIDNTTSAIGSYSTGDNITYQPYLRPYMYRAMILSQAGVGAPSLSIGRFKYIFRTGSARTPLTRIDLNNSTDLAFIHAGENGGVGTQVTVFPWLRGVVP